MNRQIRNRSKSTFFFLSPHQGALSLQVKGEHEIYCCGARVRISEKGVKVLSEPLVGYCPLHEAMYGSKRITAKTVCSDVETKIARYGFCCRNRKFDAEPIVAYGASEMMCVWLEHHLIDCAIVVCEGAGTVITANSTLVQAIGARLTGIIKTSPIPEIIKHIEANGGVVLDKTEARIDQVAGVKQALDSGFKHIAVSVAGFQAKAIREIRKLEKDLKADILVFSICNTCVSEAEVKHIARADVVCASASRTLRSEIGGKAVMQLGVAIPVYALTEKGKRFILAYLAEFGSRLVAFRTSELPYEVDSRSPKLKI
jgi:putative methanogenesis marker protein 8